MAAKSTSEGKATEQDTPGRPNSSASRQQTHPDQTTQTGSPEVDGGAAHKETSKKRPDKH